MSEWLGSTLDCSLELKRILLTPSKLTIVMQLIALGKCCPVGERLLSLHPHGAFYWKHWPNHLWTVKTLPYGQQRIMVYYHHFYHLNAQVWVSIILSRVKLVQFTDYNFAYKRAAMIIFFQMQPPSMHLKMFFMNTAILVCSINYTSQLADLTL